jgi:hypothetical protein
MLGLDRRAQHLALMTPGVPVFVCRNLLALADRDLANENALFPDAAKIATAADTSNVVPFRRRTPNPSL